MFREEDLPVMNDLKDYLRFLAYEEAMVGKRLADTENQLSRYDEKSKSIVIKQIRGHLYYYEQWRENGKIHSRSLGSVAPGSIADIECSMEEKRRLEKERRELRQLSVQLQTSKKKVRDILAGQSVLNEYTFEVYWKDEITARVYVRKSEVLVSRFIEHPVKQIFAQNKMTRDQLNQIFALRCWDKNRPDLPELLRGVGVDSFNPQEIVRRTHGVMRNDYIWFRFPGEKISGKDVLLRKI